MTMAIRERVRKAFCGILELPEICWLVYLEAI